jgi:hypothetical protein
MHNRRIRIVPRVMTFLFVGVLLIFSVGRIEAQASESEQTLWKLEHDYFRYVEDNNLTAYLGLWHKNFLGWPSVSAAPVQKDHITDWITSRTSQGLTFKLIEFKPAAIQVTGEIGVTCHTPSRRSSAAPKSAPGRSPVTGTRTPWCAIKTPCRRA